MSNDIDHNVISTSNCDSCGTRRCPVAVMHHNGAPVLAECKSCNSQEFERIARRDIDEWLSGGDCESIFGR